ncbi:MAG: tape measure protein [Atopobium sp.]|nr:tape measure protein [Atopobium sp.]
MASDYTLSAKFTVNADGFIDGVNKAQSSLSQIQNKAQEVSRSMDHSMGDASGSVQSSFAELRSRAQNIFSGIATSARNGLTNAWNAVRTNTQQITSSLIGVGQAGIAAVAGMAIQGGIDRALNIDNARKKLAGFGHDAQDIESIMDSATQSVRGTAFGLGDAATAAATLSAAGIKSGEDMTNTLKSVANVAAASGRAFNDIGVIFSSVASRGKLMGDDMLQLSSSGVPVLQLLGEYLGKTSKEVSDMVSKGQIDFHTFSEAMRIGLGEAALSSGNTLAGSFANVRAALSRLTAPIFTQAIQVLVDAFKQAAPAIDAMGKQLGNIPTFVAPIAAAFSAMALSGLAPVIANIPVLGAMLGPLSGLLSALGGPVGIAIAAFAGLVAVSPPLQEALGNLMGALGELGNALGPIFGAAIDAIVPVLNSIVEVLGGAFAVVVNGAADLIKQLADAITNLSTGGGFDAWLQSMQPVADFVMSILQPALDGLSTGAGLIVEAFSGFGEAVGGAFETLSPYIETARDAISQFAAAAQPLVDTVLQNLGVAFTTVATIVSVVFGAAFEVVGGIVMAVMGTISGIIQTTVGVIQTVIGVFVGIFTGNWQMAANGAQTVFQGMSTTVTSIVNGLSSALSGIVNGIAGTFQAVFNGISSTVGNIFHGISSTIGNVMGDAKNTVSGALDAIAGFFRGLHLEFPKIKLPHFSISGTFSLAPPSVPSLGIEWYAKGAVLTQPTMFGMNGNNAMFGGEAGPEAVAPISTLTGYISDAVNNSKSDDELISEIAGLREDVRNMRVVMDGQTVGSIVSPYVDSNLGEYKVVANR